MGNLLENSAALRDDILYNKIIEILLIKAKDCSSPLKEHIYKDAVFLIQISTRIEPYFHIEIVKEFYFIDDIYINKIQKDNFFIPNHSNILSLLFKFFSFFFFKSNTV